MWTVYLWLSSCFRCCKGVGDDSQPILKDDPYDEKLKNSSPKPNVYHAENDMSIDIRLSLCWRLLVILNRNLSIGRKMWHEYIVNHWSTWGKIRCDWSFLGLLLQGEPGWKKLSYGKRKSTPRKQGNRRLVSPHLSSLSHSVTSQLILLHGPGNPLSFHYR